MKSFHLKNKFGKILVSLTVFSILCFSPHTGYSQDASFEASVDRTTVELGSFLELTLTVKGRTNSASPPKLPDIDGFELKYLGPFISTSIVDGEYSQIIAFRYNLYPLKTGQFQFPSVNITVKGRTHATQPIVIKVVDTLPQASTPQGQPGQKSLLQDKIFITMRVPKTKVYLNERIPLTIVLFVNGLDVQNIQYPEFEHTGFSMEEYRKPMSGQIVKDGIQYRIWEFQTYVYPTRTGKLSLGPAKQISTIRIKKSGARKRTGRFGGLFDDNFFGGFLNTYTTLALTLQSEGWAINVLPFPGKGKPRDFSGAVGQFDFTVSVSPTTVQVGDPVTVRMRVSGEGNLKAVTMPAFFARKGAGQIFKFYDPQISEEAGAKILEQVVIPTTDRVKELPAIHFSYLDAGDGRYKTITKGPFPLSVTAVAEGEELKVVGLPLGAELGLQMPEESLGRDIIFIKDHPGSFQPVGFQLYKNFVFLLVLGILVVVWAMFWVTYRITHKIKTDVKFAQRLRAPGAARKGLLEAKNHMNRIEETQFYDTLFRTLQNYFSNKFQMASGVITIDAIRDIISTRRMNGVVIEDIKLTFDECEMVRYASAKRDKEKMKDIYHKAERIIDFFERNWR